jgi:gamma-glutamylcyclotransferase (GGCT)/AIG2-like uncharacterized protein YtfP
MTDLFCYGTLEFPEVMAAVAGRTFARESATLDDYACFLLKGKIYPGVITSIGTKTPGTLYRGVTPECMQLLNEFEDEVYAKMMLPVHTESNQLQQAMVYVIPNHKSWAITNTPWNKEFFERHHLQSYVATLLLE